MALSKLFSSTNKLDNKGSTPKQKSLNLTDDYNVNFPTEKNSLVFANLIEFSLCDYDSISFKISNLLSIGWTLPNTNNNDGNNRFSCKIHEYVTCSTLTECLQYTFDSFLVLTSPKPADKSNESKKSPQKNNVMMGNNLMINDSYNDDFEISKTGSKKSVSPGPDGLLAEIYSWVTELYTILMQSLTLRQKAYLFSIGSDRKTRKYKLIHEYKDCIVGKEGVDWMLTHRMASSRQESVELGQKMLSKGYLSHVCYDHQFEDKDLWYSFDDVLIEKVKNNLDENMNDDHYLKRQALTRKQSQKLALFQHYRLKKHNEIIQFLCTMTITPETEVNLLLDASKCFYLPTSLNLSQLEDENVNANLNGYDDDIKSKNESLRDNNKFVCKVIDNVSFETMIEVIQFILTELWEQNYAQNIYDKLTAMLTITQKAKLFSIGADRKNRTYHFKKYKDCFIGSEGVEWLINAKFVKDKYQAIDLGNTFCGKGFLSHCTNDHKFKDEKLFYVFNDGAIDKECMMEGYHRQQLLHKKLKQKKEELSRVKSLNTINEDDNNNSSNLMDVSFNELNDDLINEHRYYKKTKMNGNYSQDHTITLSKFYSESQTGPIMEETVVAKLSDDEKENHDDDKNKQLSDDELYKHKMSFVVSKVPSIPDDDDD